jgi:WhiB family transcriptional regulator, redox-sensing transcriptional regulator
MAAQDPRPPWAGTALPQWYARAECSQVHVDIFFKEEHEELAKRVCKSCPVRAQCSNWALSAGSSLHGVWGGLTWNDRQRIRKAQRRTGAA